MSVLKDHYQALIFDFDGVLADSVDIKTEAFRRIYAAHGDDVVDRVVEHHRIHGGVSRTEKIRYCHREFLGVEIGIEEAAALVARFGELVEQAVSTCDEIPGAEAALQAWHARGTSLYVASGTPQPELRRVIAARGLMPYFADVRGTPPEKEETVREIVLMGGYDPANCLMVGDSITDYDAAAGANMPFLGCVPEGRPSPFPDGTECIADLHALARAAGGS